MGFPGEEIVSTAVEKLSDTLILDTKSLNAVVTGTNIEAKMSVAVKDNNTLEMEALYSASELDIMQIESHRKFGIKLVTDANNQERIINNTKHILSRKQQEVKEAHQKVEVLKKLKEKQEKEFYKSFLQAEMKEIDDITSARFRLG